MAAIHFQMVISMLSYNIPVIADYCRYKGLVVLVLHQVLVGPYHRVRSTKRGGRARPSSAGR